MNPAERQKLVRVLGMLGSDHDGERAAAGFLATRILAAAGVTWDVVISTGREDARADRGVNRVTRASAMATCVRHRSALTSWEVRFLDGVQRRLTLSGKQMATLLKIASELPSRCAR